MTTSFELQIQLPGKLYRELKRVAADLQKTESEVAAEAIRAYLNQLQSVDPLLGLFADEPDFIDAVTADVMLSREETPWRISDLDR